jgi:hypothetical protein
MNPHVSRRPVSVWNLNSYRAIKKGVGIFIGVGVGVGIGVSLFMPNATYGVATPSNRIVFLINATLEDQAGHGQPDLDEANWRGYIRQKFPDPMIRIIRIRASSNAEIRHQLETSIDEFSEIHGLYFLSHGTSGVKPSGKPFSLVSSENEKVQINLLDYSDVQNVFGPLIGRFEKGVYIHFSGCSVVGPEKVEEVESDFEKISGNFGLENGSIFLNKTVRFDYMETYFRRIDGKIYPKLALLSYASNYVWPVIPFVLLFEKKIFNRGYVYVKEAGRGNLFPIHGHKARRSYDYK